MYNIDLLDDVAPTGRLERAEYDDPWNYCPGALIGLSFSASGGEMDDRESDDFEGLTDEEEQELAELDAFNETRDEDEIASPLATRTTIRNGSAVEGRDLRH